MMFTGWRNGEIINNIITAQDHFYLFFKEKGFQYTEGYLSAFSGLRKKLAEWNVSGESNKYLGAKRYFEETQKGVK